MIDARRRKSVRNRAGGHCEYCRLPEWALPLATFHVEHITARVHGGGDGLVNLALACHHCNSHKGPNLSGIDPATRELARLFHPRRDRWEEHFHWRGLRLVGRTAVGRTTIRTLAMNHAESIAVRRALIAEGEFPPG